MNLFVVLEDVGGYLDREQIPFTVVGALALHAYGYSRTTNDVDVLVGQSEQDRLVTYLEKRGFETLHRTTGYSNHLHTDASLGRLDVVYVDPETSEKIFAEARRVDLGGMKMLVPKPEHLIAMKVHAMKNDPGRTFREMADIQFLASLPSVDRREIRKYFEGAGLMERFHELERSL